MLDSVEQAPVSVGQWVYVKRLREDTGLDGDIVERVGQVTGIGDRGWWVKFGDKSYSIRGPNSRDTHRLIPVEARRETLLTDQLLDVNAERYDRAHDLCESKWRALWADIQVNGMRHPPVVLEDLTIWAGLSRVYAHHMGGAGQVKCFIIRGDL